MKWRFVVNAQRTVRGLKDSYAGVLKEREYDDLERTDAVLEWARLVYRQLQLARNQLLEAEDAGQTARVLCYDLVKLLEK